MLRDRHDLAPPLSPPPIFSVSSSSREKKRVRERRERVYEFSREIFATLSRKYPRLPRTYLSLRTETQTRYYAKDEREGEGERHSVPVCVLALSPLSSRGHFSSSLPASHLPLARSLALSSFSLVRSSTLFSPSRTAYRKTSGSDVNQA